MSLVEALRYLKLKNQLSAMSETLPKYRVTTHARPQHSCPFATLVSDRDALTTTSSTSHTPHAAAALAGSCGSFWHDFNTGGLAQSSQ